jgi:hypothetical protein
MGMAKERAGEFTVIATKFKSAFYPHKNHVKL